MDEYKKQLRDEFAKIALPALITGRTWDGSGIEIIEQWAIAAYAIADQMLLERAK